MSKKINKISTKEISTSTNSWSSWFPYILGFITFLIYLNSIQNGYNLDDELVTRNHQLTSNGLSTIWEIFTSPYYSDDMGYNYGYRPMVHLTFAIEHYFFGEDPQIGHLINVLIYIFVVVLGYKFLVNLVGEKNQKIAFFSMLIFAVHPVHTEVVDSLKNRDELLALFFALISLSFLTKQNFNEKKYLWFLFFCVFMIFSILSKKSSIPMFFCAPLLIVNIDKFHPIHYFVISFILNLLVATFGSDFNPVLFVKLFLIGNFLSLSFFAIKNLSNWYKHLPETFLIKNNYSIFLIISFFIFFIYSIFFKSIEVLILSYAVLAIFIYLETTKKEMISLLVLFSLFFTGLFFKISVLNDISSMLSIFFLFDLIKKTNKIKLHYRYFIYLIPILFNSYGFLNFEQFIGSIILLIILILVYKYEWIKYMLLIGFLALFAFINEIDLEAVLFLILLFYDKFKFLEKIKVSYYHIVLFGIITFLALDNNKDQIINPNSSSKTEITTAKSNNIISEGRQLNFVENPLVNSTDKKRKVMIGFETTGQYLKLLIFPYPLKFYYGYNVVQTSSKLSFELIIGILFFILLFVFVSFLLKNKNFYLLFFVLSLLLSFLLFSNWLVLVAGIIGERLIFAASFSIIFVFVYLFLNSNSFSLLVKNIILALVVVLFSFSTIQRNFDWKDSLILMSNDIKHLQNSAQANNLYAFSLMRESFENTLLSPNQVLETRKKAIYHLEKAVKIYPEFSNAWHDLGRARMTIADTNNAVYAYQIAINLKPDFPDSYYDLLSIFESQNKRLKHLFFSRKLYKNVNDPEAVIIMSKSFVANNKVDSAFLILNKANYEFKNNSRIESNIKELIVYKNLTRH